MNRREFNTLAAAALVAAGLPPLPAAAHHGLDEPGPQGDPGLPGVERAYLTVTGGTVVYKSGRAVGKSTASSLGSLCLTGTVVSCVGYFPADPRPYCLGQAFVDSFAKAGDIVTEFERLRHFWSPRECLVEANTMAEKLLGDQPGVILVSEQGLALSEPELAIDVGPVRKPAAAGWGVVGPCEPTGSCGLREILPARRIRGEVSGEALQALQVGRRLAEIHRWHLASLHLPPPAELPWPSA